MMRRVANHRPLVLASASPRRRELLGLLGLDFSARVASVDETPGPHEPAVAVVQRFAREKAAAVARQLRSNGSPMVIGADTIVVLDGEVLGKPRDAEDAVAILQRLRGREHRVYTALAIFESPQDKPCEWLACTTVPMRDFSDQEIHDYVRSGDPFDKAGAYAIQNPSFHPVAHMRGCYANVMGLPLCHLTAALRELGVEPPADVPLACQGRLDYQCSVFERVLATPDATCTGGDLGESG